MNTGWGRNHTIYYTLIPSIECFLENAVPVLQVLLPNCHRNCVFKRQFYHCLIRMLGNVISLVNSMSVKPVWYSSDYEMNSLVRSNAVWKTILVDKRRKLSDGSFGRCIMCREEKSVTRLSFYPGKNNALPFLRRKWSSVVNLPPVHWPVIPENGAIWKFSEKREADLSH